MNHRFLNLLFALILIVSISKAQTPEGSQNNVINTPTALSSRKQYLSDKLQLEVSVAPGLLANNLANFTLGAEVSLRNRVSRNLEVVVSTGLTHYFGNYSHYVGNYYLDNPNALPQSTTSALIKQLERNIIPLEAGLRVYAGNRFYLQGQAGAAFGLHGTTTFMYTPSLGMMFANGLDISAKYDNYKSSALPDVVSLKLGYNLKLK